MRNVRREFNRRRTGLAGYLRCWRRWPVPGGEAAHSLDELLRLRDAGHLRVLRGRSGISDDRAGVVASGAVVGLQPDLVLAGLGRADVGEAAQAPTPPGVTAISDSTGKSPICLHTQRMICRILQL
jgi:hypothetical protein